jgi:GMP reductase
VVADNMDTVGTFEMAAELTNTQLFTTIHKYYSVDQWKKFAETADPKVLCSSHGSSMYCCLPILCICNELFELFGNIAVSSGMSDSDFDKLRAVCEAVPQVDYICLDVANGYSEHFVEFIRKVREGFPRHTIFAGNVVTGEMVEELILAGADVVKVC